MSIKRLALAGIIAAALTLTACTGTGNQNPTASPTDTPTPTPTATSITGEAPADEDEAITKAEAAIELLLATQAQVTGEGNGGTDTAPYEAVATGAALQRYIEDAARIANGPTLNEDGESIDGPSTVEGAVVFEPMTAYGQEWQGVPNGLVLVPGCLDLSGRKITTADGKPAMQNPNLRNQFEFQVSYDAESKTWKVSNLIDLGATC
ncbi:hypothetical protein [Microbacterium sp. YJN-G]|uniref:hypothetical protein n=1 Tax=Microbacterium sp. YJN-G TaxID=2763257 RepID=UPI0018777324|nr:hypothetical protein [Microbacterium sp. YJN-G]